ncbi:MAG: prolyl oligopeptidase family serine peptidase [Thermoprotei archaeon]
MSEFEYLENLEDGATKKFVSEVNNEVRGRLGGRAQKHFGSLLERLKGEVPVSVVGLGEGYAVLYRSQGGGFVDMPNSRISSGSSGEIFHSLGRVWNADMLCVGVGLNGSDEGYSILADASGVVKLRLEGLVKDFFYFNGELFYVRAYRRGVSPDGVSPPVERVLCGDRVVPLYPERGESLSVKASGGLVSVVRSRGWSNQKLYLAERLDSADDFNKMDEGKIVSFDIVDGKVYYVKDNTVMCGGQPLFGLENPVVSARFTPSGVVVEEIRDYRTTLTMYTYTGEVSWRYSGANIYSFDVVGDKVVALESSFNTQYTILKIGEGVPTVMGKGRVENIRADDLYLKSDVLLHGFLLSRGGSRGVVVYGYGGFSVPVLPTYNPLFCELVDAGFSVLVTNLRGGSENGEEWHRQGMLRNKHNVFKDYAAFLTLVKNLGSKTVCMGASNGGLLVGATLNSHPEKVDCAVIGYPVLDMLNYHRFLAGLYWVYEYGNPEGQDREYLASYSPYHNLRGGLPPVFVYTGLNDDRVHPMHALKYAAKSKSLGNNVLLHVNARSGHNLSDPEPKAEEMSYIVAFIELQLNPVGQSN